MFFCFLLVIYNFGYGLPYDIEVFAPMYTKNLLKMNQLSGKLRKYLVDFSLARFADPTIEIQ